MKPLVNLASEPFQNRRLFWLAILLLFTVPSYFGLRALEKMATLHLEISNHTQAVRNLETQLKKIEKPERRNVNISLDQNRNLVAASELIARRSFSWSQLLSDIERNLPTTVRILRISVVQIQPQEREGVVGANEIAASLMLDVAGKSNQDVTLMINKFNDSQRFKVVPISKKAIEGTDEAEFQLKVDYFPLLSGSKSNLGNQIASGAEKVQ